RERGDVADRLQCKARQQSAHARHRVEAVPGDAQRLVTVRPVEASGEPRQLRRAVDKAAGKKERAAKVAAKACRPEVLHLEVAAHPGDRARCLQFVCKRLLRAPKWRLHTRRNTCKCGKPTPGLEPGTPSLRVKCSTS